MSGVIKLPMLPAPIDQLWHTLIDLDDRLDVPWSLVGGQMVLLHALEHGEVPPQISQDGDVIADIRAVPGALTQVVECLEDLGLALQSISADGLAHRYTRPAVPRHVVIDVLAPEGLGERAHLTTSPPGRTIEVPGGTQALNRTEHVRVVHEGRTGTIPRPTLLAAIVAKAAATALPSPERHYRDLALLCALVADPFDLVEQMTPKDRQRLRLANALLEPSHQAWLLVPASRRSAGRIAFGVLRG
ncbi:MAG TPA: hypothetical protein VFJ19_16915 [Nocardioidaceae bacterium]|nr:hypothetical protein [Nocardioidaceae bacterium]